jgi:hypothetical protein
MNVLAFIHSGCEALRLGGERRSEKFCQKFPNIAVNSLVGARDAN